MLTPIQVPAKVALTVTETQQPGFVLDSVHAQPARALLSQNPAANTATVKVAAGADPTHETRVLFSNSAVTGRLQVCKLLAADSAALQGTTFTFEATGAATNLPGARGSLGTLNVTPTATGPDHGACALLPGRLPVGSQVA